MGNVNGSSSAPLDFTGGDTFKRFTVTNPLVTGQSQINCSIRKHEISETDDVGWAYVANVVSVVSGSFDVNVSAFSQNAEPSTGEYPNETISLVYLIQ